MEWTSIVDCAYDCTIDVGNAHTDTVAADIQLKDFEGNNLTVPAGVKAYLSTEATGLTVNSTVSLTTDLSASVGSRAILTANKAYLLISNTSGVITVSMYYTTTDDLYLVVVMPNGKRVVSSKFDFL